jgi:hypothetical protein
MDQRPVPIACSLPAGERSGRLDEFRALFAGLLEPADRRAGTLRLLLPAGAEAAARDLFAREQDCCPFFAVGFQGVAGGLEVEVSVPPGAEELLDGLAGLAPSRAQAAS